MLCPICTNWAREAADSLPAHHPNCPLVEEACGFIQRTAEATPFLTAAGINQLPYRLWSAVADMMAEFALHHVTKEKPMSVRAKVRCNGVTGNEVQFTTVYEPDSEKDSENARFTKATPWGEIKLGIDNPVALEQFEAGKEYYVDFTPAAPPCVR